MNEVAKFRKGTDIRGRAIGGLWPRSSEFDTSERGCFRCRPGGESSGVAKSFARPPNIVATVQPLPARRGAQPARRANLPPVPLHYGSGLKNIALNLSAIIAELTPSRLLSTTT